MNKLYKFRWDCGRQGILSGLFVADDAEISAAIGKPVYFGEVLGKHSEISGTLDEPDLVVLTDDQAWIEKFQVFGCASGFNPLNYLPETEDES